MKRLRRRASLLIILLSLVLITTGCWGRRETDEVAYILALGIDKGEESVNKVTFVIAIPSALGGAKGGGGGGGGGDKATEIISVEAASLFGALQMANIFLSRELSLIHNEMIIVSAEIAQEGLDKFLNPLLRSRDIRRNATIAVTQGSAAEFLKSNQESLERNPSRQFFLSLEKGRYTGLTLKTSLNEFAKRAKSPGSSPVLTLLGVNSAEQNEAGSSTKSYEEKISLEASYLPGELNRQGGNKVEIIGLAAFHGEHLVGYLNGTETRYYQMLINKFQSADFTFPDLQAEEMANIVKITKGRSPVIKVDLKGERPVINIKLILEGEIMSIQSGINYEEPQKIKELEAQIEESIRDGVMDLIRRSQFDLKSDIFGLGEFTRRHFTTWDQWVQYSWVQKYLTANVQVEVALEIRRTGLMNKTASIPEVGPE